MYRAHFNLRQKPFQISPDPRFLWLGEAHKEALSRLKYGIRDNRGFLLLVGDVGTGKTTLVNRLLESLDENVLVAVIPDPGLEKLDFYNFLAHAFNLDKKFTSKSDFLVHFVHFLHRSNADNKRVLIIIDEAQRLNHEMLEEIRQLSNIETQSSKLLNIFLVGQIEFNEILLETRNQALLQRITTRFNIGPIPEKEVEAYIKFRLKVAGCEKQIFNSGAVRQIFSFSNGYPRLINVICDHSLLTAFVKGIKKIDARIVKESAEDLRITTEKLKPERKGGTFRKIVNLLYYPRRQPFLSLPIYALLLVLLAGMATYVYSPGVLPADKPYTLLTAVKDKVASTFFAPVPVPDTSPGASGKIIIPQPTPQEKALPAPAVVEKTVQPRTATNMVNETVLPKAELDHYLNQPLIIRFRMDSNEFSDDAYEYLNRIAHVIKQKPGIKVSVSGYTDSLGNAQYNRRLSTYRAAAVKSYFIGRGISPAQVTVYGRGPDSPIESNETREGRSANRRVEILLEE